MSTESVGDIFGYYMANLEQKREKAALEQKTIAATVIDTSPQFIRVEDMIIIPAEKSWNDLKGMIFPLINFDGLWSTARELYEQGYGKELETAIEIATQTARKSPICLFATMISKKAGNWEERTLNIVHEAWKVRHNARTVIEALGLKSDSTKAILKLCWRLRDNVLRYLAMATEQGVGIRNPIGLFFYLTKDPAPN